VHEASSSDAQPKELLPTKDAAAPSPTSTSSASKAPAAISVPRAAASSARSAWQLVDRIVMVVNEDMLTNRMLEHDVDSYRRQRAIAKEEEARALVEFQQMRVRNMLEVQAGQDMGIDPAIVKQQVKENVEHLIRERFSGVAGLADFLQSKDLDTDTLREQFKDQIYADVWEKYITGEAPLPGGRIARDRYVRPGLMRLYYESGVRQPDGLDQIGGKQQEVVLQYLFIDEKAYGGEQKTRELLQTLRQRIVDGEDMGDICERYSAWHTAKTDRGLMQSVPESRFANLDPQIATFLTSAKPGDVSGPLPYKTTDGGHFWRIAKLVDRTAPVVPDISSSDVQQKVIQRIQDEYDQFRKAVALGQMYRGSYVWPPELSQQ
jgi:parvulin-like peptidyl-prolyl isomerase